MEAWRQKLVDDYNREKGGGLPVSAGPRKIKLSAAVEKFEAFAWKSFAAGDMALRTLERHVKYAEMFSYYYPKADAADALSNGLQNFLTSPDPVLSENSSTSVLKRLRGKPI